MELGGVGEDAPGLGRQASTQGKTALDDPWSSDSVLRKKKTPKCSLAEPRPRFHRLPTGRTLTTLVGAVIHLRAARKPRI